MTSNDGLQNELEKLCECAICFDRVANPRTLPCDHSFCKDCLEELVQFKQRNIPYVQCPSRCGEHYMAPGSSVSKMKASLYLRQLLDLLEKTGHASTESSNSEPFCSIKTCQRQPRVYCTTCKMFLCSECAKRPGSCREKHEVKPVRYSKTRGTFEPSCCKHECSAIYYCQTCSIKYLCKYCKQYNHFDHRVNELTFEHVFRPYKNQEKTLQNYTEKFGDLNSAITCLWKNIEETQENFTRYLEKRRLESVLQFFDQLIAAENSIRQQYQSKVQNFLEEIVDRKHRFDEVISKNERYSELLQHLEGKSLVELLYNGKLATIDGLVKENQSTYKSFSQLDDFKIFVSPNKDLDFDRPFGYINFSKDVMKDEEIKKLYVLNPISEMRKEREEKEREKQYGIMREKLQLLFADSGVAISTSLDSKRFVSRRNSESSIEDSKVRSNRHVIQRSLSECFGDISNEILDSIIDDKQFKEKLASIHGDTDKDEHDGVECGAVPPDLPERAPIKSPCHPPPTLFVRKASTTEPQHLSILPEQIITQLKTEIVKEKSPLLHEQLINKDSNHGKNLDQQKPRENVLTTTITTKDSIPTRTQVKEKQKRRPPVLPKPDRSKHPTNCSKDKGTMME